MKALEAARTAVLAFQRGLFAAAHETGIGPFVWTGRALQAESDDLEMIGLAHLYPAREWNYCVPGHDGYPRALDLIRNSAPKAIWAT